MTALPSKPGQIATWMLTVEQVAGSLGISRMSTYRLIHGGELRAYKFGRSFRVDASDLQRYMQGAVHEWGVA